MSTKYYDHTNKQRYQRLYRARANLLCECGRARTLRQGNRYVCPFCAPHETQEAFHQLHKTMAGVRNNIGLPTFALCIPGGAENFH
jgi:hypothetical protein